MIKQKVSRYVAGKRPDYAPDSSDEEDDELKFQLKDKRSGFSITSKPYREDQQDEEEDEEEEDDSKFTLKDESAGLSVTEHVRPTNIKRSERELITHESEDEIEEEEEEEELDEEEIERRRASLRLRAMRNREEEELMDVEEEKEEVVEEESSEYEEYTDSEEEDAEPRLKPVFVRKKDRVTIQEKEREEEHQRILEQEARRLADERRRYTLKMAEEEARKEVEHERNLNKADPLTLVVSEDENDEEEYEAWKLRELKRIKRDRDQREQIEKERQEVEKLRNMTDAERKNMTRIITNKKEKGRYRFLQKYFHRGAFFLDKEDDVYKRDFAQPTLEDHFDKTVLPQVMQVKNFGRSGRTKYTHLVDQDTSVKDSPWFDGSNAKLNSTAFNLERPSRKK